MEYAILSLLEFLKILSLVALIAVAWFASILFVFGWLKDETKIVRDVFMSVLLYAFEVCACVVKNFFLLSVYIYRYLRSLVFKLKN